MDLLVLIAMFVGILVYKKSSLKVVESVTTGQGKRNINEIPVGSNLGLKKHKDAFMFIVRQFGL